MGRVCFLSIPHWLQASSKRRGFLEAAMTCYFFAGACNESTPLDVFSSSMVGVDPCFSSIRRKLRGSLAPNLKECIDLYLFVLHFGTVIEFLLDPVAIPLHLCGFGFCPDFTFLIA